MKMTGRPGQTRPLAKERENEENISLVEDKKNREDIEKSRRKYSNKSRHQRQILNDFAWQSVPSNLHL